MVHLWLPLFINTLLENNENWYTGWENHLDFKIWQSICSQSIPCGGRTLWYWPNHIIWYSPPEVSLCLDEFSSVTYFLAIQEQISNLVIKSMQWSTVFISHAPVEIHLLMVLSCRVFGDTCRIHKLTQYIAKMKKTAAHVVSYSAPILPLRLDELLLKWGICQMPQCVVYILLIHLLQTLSHMHTFT